MCAFKAAMLVVLIVMSSACFCVRRASVPGLTAIPQILFDYINDTVIIYVHGLLDYVYTNITVVLHEDGRTETYRDNYTYAIYVKSSMQNFTVNTTVYDKNKKYVYNGLVGIERNHVYIEKHLEEKVEAISMSYDSLPYKALLWEAK